MAINLQALNKFRSTTEWTGTTVANLGGGNSVKESGTYKGAFSSLGRSSIEKAANNAVRTEFLRTLGKTFDQPGMTQQNGKVTFSKDFMDRLEKILGADFKRDDFKLDADGKVSSGRPLTARRIQAILAKVESAATQASIDSVGKKDGVQVFTPLGGLRKDDTYAPYAGKLAVIQKDLASLDKNKFEHVHAFFKRVAATLDFLSNELDLARSGEGDYDYSAMRNDQTYEYEKSIGAVKAGAKPIFQYYDDAQKKFVKLESVFKYQNEVLWHKLGGGLLHLEWAPFDLEKSDDVAPLKKYIVNNARLFVMKSIDCYFDAKKAGKTDLFFQHLRSPGACVEDQCMHMVEFEETHLSDGLVAPSKEEADEIRRIANQDPNDDSPKVDKLINDVFEELNAKPWFVGKDSFDEDIAKVLRERLVGTTATITTYDKSTHKFKPLLVDGKNVVRPLTKEDVDAIGATIYKEVYG